jgi:hypothetical protein
MTIRKDQSFQTRPPGQPCKTDTPNAIVEANRPGPFVGLAEEIAKIVADKLKEELSGSADQCNRQLKSVYEQAYCAYEVAVTRLGQEPTDRKAWEYLKEFGPAEYKLPDFKTFSRYLRKARQHYGTRKHNRRLGRTGRSLIHHSESEFTSQLD